MLNLANIFPILIGKTALTFDTAQVTAQLATSPLDQPELAELREQIESYLDEYAARAGMNPLAITSSWTTTLIKGEQILRHRHPNSAVSGAVYVQLPEDCQCDLEFWDPNNGLRMLEQPLKERRLRAQAQQGDLILWPSWLEHETRKNISDITRISINFNANFKSE